MDVDISNTRWDCAELVGAGGEAPTLISCSTTILRFDAVGNSEGPLQRQANLVKGFAAWAKASPSTNIRRCPATRETIGPHSQVYSTPPLFRFVTVASSWVRPTGSAERLRVRRQNCPGDHGAYRAARATWPMSSTKKLVDRTAPAPLSGNTATAFSNVLISSCDPSLGNPRGGQNHAGRSAGR
jgi:hypothetical protein